MPIFPGPVRHNNANAPILKLVENQVQGMGTFADLAARTALGAALRVEGYIAVVKDIDRTYIYTSSDLGDSAWGVSANWKLQGGDHYIHTEAPASNTWVVTHSLEKYPNVTIVDDSGVTVDGFGLVYNSLTQLTITFKSAGILQEVAGVAYMN
jgi:hypothetical protein